MATRSKSSKSSHKSSRKGGAPYCALIIATLLAFLLAASVAVLLWKMFALSSDFDKLCKGEWYEGQMLGTDGGVVQTRGETRVQKLFPGFFRTTSIQERVETQRRASFNHSLTETRPANNCNFDCTTGGATQPANIFQQIPGLSRTTSIPGRFLPRGPAASPRIRGGPFGDFVYHSCCSSGTRYITPSKVWNLNNVEVEIVQEDKYKQYFLEESCDPDIRCSGCTCGQPEPFIYTAVVYKNKQAEESDEKYEIDSIRIPGACKCLNK